MSSAALVSSPSSIPLPSDLSSPSSSFTSLPSSPLSDGNKENVPHLANMTTESTTDVAATISDADKTEKPTSTTNSHDAQHATHAHHTHTTHNSGKEERTSEVMTAAADANDEDAADSSTAAATTNSLDASYMDVMDSPTLLSHGQSLLSSKKWNVACEALSRCVERAAAEYGDTALPLAPLYALYGRALVDHWMSAQHALGDKVREVQAEKRINEGEGGLIGDDDVDEDGQPQLDTDAVTDDSAAWEVLDLARVIYQRHYDAMANDDTAASSSPSAPSTPYPLPVPTTRHAMGLALVSVLLRLGDLHQEQEKFVEAATDYHQALNLQRALLPVHSRDRAATHMELAVCSLWQQQPALALQHYTHAYITFHYRLLWLMAGKPTSLEQLLSDDIGEEKRLLESRVKLMDGEWKSESEAEKKEAAEYVDLIAELKERIDEMVSEVGKQATSSTAASSSSSFSLSSSASSSSSSSGFSSSPFSIPPLSFSVPLPSTATNQPTASASDDVAGMKRKAAEEAGAANGKEEAEVFNVPVVKRKKL